MKPGKVAKAFGLDRKTVTNWTDMPQFQKFFTSEALGIDRTQRDYLEPDLWVINTIRVMRNKSMDWDEIEIALIDGDRERELPPSAMLVETTAPIAQYGRIIELQTALESAEEQIDELKEEVDKLRSEAQEKDHKYQERVDSVRTEEREIARNREQELTDQLIQLNRQIARLELRIEIMQEGDDENE